MSSLKEFVNSDKGKAILEKWKRGEGSGEVVKLELAPGTQPQTVNGITEALVRPSKQYPFSQIKRGPNPRNIKLDKTVHKDIANSWLADDGKFNIKSRGAQIIIDPGSLSYDDNYIYLEVDAKLAGHSDGQHSMCIVDMVNECCTDAKNNVFRLQIAESNIFTDAEELRSAASAINKGSDQQNTSEFNMLGEFEFVKRHILYTDLANIEWLENQENVNGETLSVEVGAPQLIKLLLLMAPLTDRTGYGVSSIASLAKKGVQTVVKTHLENEQSLEILQLAAPHVDYILELSDFIQKSIERVSGPYYANLAMIRSCTKAAFKKPVDKRKKVTQKTFDAQEVSGAFNKDFILLFLHALLGECFDFDHAANEFYEVKPLSEAKQIWLRYGGDMIQRADSDFQKSFSGANTNNRRASDFVNDETLWHAQSKLLRKALQKNHNSHRSETVFETQPLEVEEI